MKQIWHVLDSVHPELVAEVRKRHDVLRYIHLLQPVGRRNLTTHLQLTERTIRTEMESLQELGLISSNNRGMSLTRKGFHILQQLDAYLRDSSDLGSLAAELEERLAIEEVIVVAGDSEQDPLVKKEMGRQAALKLVSLFEHASVVSLTGGTSVASVAELMPSLQEFPDLLFLPARGGLGQKMETQANTLVSMMAEKAGGRYRLLHLPDHLSEASYQSLKKEPQIKEYLNLIAESDIIVHGIGDALNMAEKRQMDDSILQLLQQEKAVGEAFGYYFNQQGDVVYKMPNIGIQLDQVRNASYVLAVAGGASKAKAIAAVAKQQLQQVLVTDQAAAERLLGETRR
ncbi:MAG: hypothetical protein H0Z33_06425 [Bacillaceae bacterium]|nr:hypothetical protein [Bacillaceae bacterium]